jgi:hypothetical protein
MVFSEVCPKIDPSLSVTSFFSAIITGMENGSEYYRNVP